MNEGSGGGAEEWNALEKQTRAIGRKHQQNEQEKNQEGLEAGNSNLENIDFEVVSFSQQVWRCLYAPVGNKMENSRCGAQLFGNVRRYFSIFYDAFCQIRLLVFCSSGADHNPEEEGRVNSTGLK